MRHHPLLLRLAGLVLSVSAVLAVPAALAAAEGEALRMYDITDLLQKPHDLPAQQLGINVDATVDEKKAGEQAIAADTTAEDGWTTLLTRAFTPEIVPLIRAHAEFRSGTLFLTAGPELQQHVERAFASLRQASALQVRIAARMYLMAPQLRRDSFSFAGLPWTPVAGAPGQMAAEVSAAELEIMHSTLGKPGNGVTCVASPTIASWAGQRASAAYIKQLAYVPVFFDAPHVSVATLGEVLEVRTTPTPDHLLATLDITHSVCSLIDLRSVDLGHGDKAEEPVLWRGGETLTRTLPLGRSLVLATGVYLDGKESRAGFLTITPTLIDPAAPAETAIVR